MKSHFYARALCLMLPLLTSCESLLPGDMQPSQRAVPSRTITVGLVQVGSLDPPRAVGEGAHTGLRTACDPLISLDPAIPEPRPALVMRWTMSPDAKLLSLKLRPRVNYQDGSPVDATSIRENLSRAVRPTTASPWASLLSAVSGYQDVVTGTAEHLSGLKVTDQTTLQIHLDRPGSDFPGSLSHPGLTPVSPGSLANEPVTPSCAGPYKVEAGAKEGDLRMTKAGGSRSKNEAFTNSGKGFIETILIRNFESADVAFEAFKAGELDVSPVPEQRVSEALSMDRDHYQQLIPETSYLAFDPAGIPDPRVRKAISLSIDRLVIIDAAFGDLRQPALRWIPELFGSRIESRCSESVRKIADPTRAKVMLTEAGVDPATLKLSLAFDSSRTGRLVTQAMQVQVKDALGIDMVPLPMEPEAFEVSLKQRGKPMIWMLTTIVDVPTLDQVLGGSFGSGSADNRIGFDDPETTALLLSASSAVDPDERYKKYSEVEDRVCDLMPASPLWNASRHWMFRRSTVEFQDRAKIDLVGSPVLRHVAGA
ncbi:MAG TPA: ABC transporter substrate-binding protein [Actinomycetota bacterium]|nr:ABC transporter substrate-binding protein [Actinomycetota bacterium]